MANNDEDAITLAEVHDCFSITELLIYEDFGFSPRGRAKEDVDSGFFTRQGGDYRLMWTAGLSVLAIRSGPAAGA